MPGKPINQLAGFAALSLMTILFALIIYHQPHKMPYSPEVSAVPATAGRSRTAVWIDDTVHYNLRDGTADTEFYKLAPPVSSEDPESQFSSTAMVHQLQCLQVLREEYVAGRLTEMGQHCMEYLRQSILCAADTRLESVRFFRPPHVVALPGEYECKDWTEVLKKVI